MNYLDISAVKFDQFGLVPVVVQDENTKDVLMVAYANQESLAMTEELGQMVFYSRSRSELWHKGATSGNTLNVKSIMVDCDSDTLLATVVPNGPACHRGTTTCFEVES